MILRLQLARSSFCRRYFNATHLQGRATPATSEIDLLVNETHLKVRIVWASLSSVSCDWNQRCNENWSGMTSEKGYFVTSNKGFDWFGVSEKNFGVSSACSDHSWLKTAFLRKMKSYSAGSLVYDPIRIFRHFEQRSWLVQSFQKERQGVLLSVPNTVLPRADEASVKRNCERGTVQEPTSSHNLHFVCLR